VGKRFRWRVLRERSYVSSERGFERSSLFSSLIMVLFLCRLKGFSYWIFASAMAAQIVLVETVGGVRG
jgi:hypothetical protein